MTLFADRSPRPLVAVAFAVVAGAMADRCLNLSVVVCAAISLLLLGLPVALRRVSSRFVLAACLEPCVLWISLAGVGAAWHHLYWQTYDAAEISRFARQSAEPICVRAIAERSPERRAEARAADDGPAARVARYRLAIRVTAVRHQTTWQPASGRVLVTFAGPPPRVLRGDELSVFGHLRRTSGPVNPGQFDLALYVRAQRRLCQVSCAEGGCVAVRRRGHPGAWGNWLSRFRGLAARQIERYVSPRHAPLAAALVLGQREQLDQPAIDRFFRSGTIHLLAISGMHVGIVAYFVWTVARRLLSRRAALRATTVLVVFYAALAGAKPPVVRAAALVGAAGCARYLGRRTGGLQLLAAAALVVFGLNPASVFQAGCQLSFLAVTTMCQFLPRTNLAAPVDPLDALIERTRPRWIRATRRLVSAAVRLWWAGAVIWMATLPLVVFHFHLVAVVGLVLNPLIWLPISAALVLGVSVIVFGPVAPPLAWLCGWGCDLSLAVVEGLVGRGQQVEFGHFWCANPPGWCVALFYVGFAVLALAPPVRHPPRWLGAGLVGWLVIVGLVVAIERATTPDPVRCTFIAVGHGTCVLVELPNGRKVLYDAGRLGPAGSASLPIARVLWSRRIQRLDAVILSHADADHYNAFAELSRYIAIDQLLVSPVMFDQPVLGLDEVRAAAARRRIKLRTVAAGDRVILDRRVTMTFLHPPAGGVRGSDNANSLVLAVEYGDARILLPGDLESPGLERLLKMTPRRWDVVMAAHHGSRHSRPADFVRWSRPRVVVISAGAASPDPAVTNPFASLGARVLHTGYDGAVTIELDRHGGRARTWVTGKQVTWRTP